MFFIWIEVKDEVRKKISFDVDLNVIKRLDEVYISTRYPSDLGLLPSGRPSIEDAKELYDFADAFYRKVKKLLKPCRSS